MEYSNDMQDVYKNIEEYNPGKKRNVLIIFDDVIADTINNKKLNPIVSELRKNIFACLFSVHNTTSLSPHEQVCLMRLRFERYFSHHRAM